MEKKIECLKKALETEALRISGGDPFTLKSGRKSMYYVDCRAVIMRLEYRSLVNYSMAHIVRDMEDRKDLMFEAVGGVATGAIATAVGVADLMRRDMFYIRDRGKEHGMGMRLEGTSHLCGGAKVIVIEDVVTTGGSLVASLEAVIAAGLDPVAAFALVDRSEDPRYFLGVGSGDLKRSIPYRPLFLAREPGTLEFLR